MTDILPTYSCFDDAMDFIEARIKDNPENARTLVLVHGIAVASNGRRYAHAWVEQGLVCWDAGILEGKRIWYSTRMAEYYVARRIECKTRYSLLEAYDENVRSGHYGP